MTTTLDLEAVEASVERALVTNDNGDLHILGYGEITTVLAWPHADGPWACKRLPVFDGVHRLDAYQQLFDDYVATLTKAGIAVHETRLEQVPSAGGCLAAYLVQPVFAPEELATTMLRAASPDGGRQLLGDLLDHIGRVVTPHVGLDGQLSNWAVRDGELVYFDVTTPLLRDEHGRDRLDTELFMASLPAALRPTVRRFLLDDILDPYYAPRSAALDVLSNLHKEGLAEWVPVGVALANERLGTDLTADVVRRHYRRDARMWSALQWARRIDRSWQRRIRRRPYPFLLPGRIERNR